MFLRLTSAGWEETYFQLIKMSALSISRPTAKHSASKLASSKAFGLLLSFTAQQAEVASRQHRVCAGLQNTSPPPHFVRRITKCSVVQFYVRTTCSSSFVEYYGYFVTSILSSVVVTSCMLRLRQQAVSAQFGVEGMSLLYMLLRLSCPYMMVVFVGDFVTSSYDHHFRARQATEHAEQAQGLRPICCTTDSSSFGASAVGASPKYRPTAWLAYGQGPLAQFEIAVKTGHFGDFESSFGEDNSGQGGYI